MMEGRDTEARAWRVYPLSFFDQGKVNGIPVPLARITTCGMVTIEVLTEVEPGDPPRGRYEVIPTQTLRGRGAVPALTLLKLLAGRSHRFATSDWLCEQMRGEMEVGALVRLDTIASYLRGQLCGLKADQQQINVLRVLLVAYLRNGRGSGPGYQLAPYPLLWLDTDALASHVEHGALMERMGEPTLALPFWQQAYHLASKGVYLPDEPSSEWAQDMREQVEGSLRQSVHALSRLTLAQHGEAGEEEAMRLLRTYWQSHKIDEDALRPLMELLGKHERFAEAEQYYQQCVAALDHVEEGRRPASQTLDLYEFLRVKQLRREPKAASSALLQEVQLNGFDLSVSSLAPVVQLQHTQFTAFPETVISEQGSRVLSAYRVLALPSVSVSMPFGETEGIDWATWFGLRLAQLLVDIDCRCGQLCLCLALQERLNQELNVMEPSPTNETYTLSRRQALVAIAALPSALLMPFQQEQWLPWQIEQFLSRCTGSLTACWHLLRGNEFTAVEEVIPQYLPVLLTILRQSSAYRQIAAHLATQCHLLMSLVVRHRGVVHVNQTDVWHCQQAVFYSETAGDDAVAIAALKQLADTFYYSQWYKGMREAYEKAKHLIDTSQTPNEIPPLLRCRIYAGLADASIKDGQAEAAHHYLTLLRDTFPAYLVDDRLPLYADCGVHSLCLWEGLTLLGFGERTNQQNHYRQASMVFAKVEQFPPTLIIPERTRLEIITHQAATAVRLKNMEQFRASIEKGAEGIRALGSQKRRRELIDVYTQGVNVWPHESTVQNLAALLVS